VEERREAVCVVVVVDDDDDDDGSDSDVNAIQFAGFSFLYCCELKVHSWKLEGTFRIILKFDG